MRSLVKTIITLGILVVTIGGTYYVYKARTAKQAGGSYPIASVPGDLFRDLGALLDPGDTTPGPVPGPSSDDAPAETVPGEPGEPDPAPAAERTLYERANDHYLAGRYADAEPLLLKSLESPGSSAARPAELLARTRLFLLLLESTLPESALDGPPVGYLVMQNGRPMLVQVTEESADEIGFKAPGGITSSVKKAHARSVTIGRTREQKRAIFEREYRLRHETVRTAGEFLDLGRFSAECGLADHVTYCLERAIAAPGDGVEKALNELHSAGGPKRQELVHEMFRRFYPRSDVTAELPPPEEPELPVRVPDEKDPVAETGPDDRPSGIGGTSERKPRAPNDAVAKLLAEAGEHRKVGDEYYKKAFAGGPKASEHKDKALAAYRKAQQIYERVEKQWNVGLDRTFKDIQTRVYDLLKSIR